MIANPQNAHLQKSENGWFFSLAISSWLVQTGSWLVVTVGMRFLTSPCSIYPFIPSVQTETQNNNLQPCLCALFSKVTHTNLLYSKIARRKDHTPCQSDKVKTCHRFARAAEGSLPAATFHFKDKSLPCQAQPEARAHGPGGNPVVTTGTRRAGALAHRSALMPDKAGVGLKHAGQLPPRSPGQRRPLRVPLVAQAAR